MTEHDAAAGTGPQSQTQAQALAQVQARSPDVPDAERLYAELLGQVRAALAARPREVHVVGIHTGGAWVADRLHRDLGLDTPIGYLSSAFHRDDYDARGMPAHPKATHLPFEIAGADLLLVDDILFTGRTVRAALNELFDYGRPARVELAVLIDRGGRELPVAADYLGASRPLAPPSQYVLSQDTSGRLSLRIEQEP